MITPDTGNCNNKCTDCREKIQSLHYGYHRMPFSGKTCFPWIWKDIKVTWPEKNLLFQAAFSNIALHTGNRANPGQYMKNGLADGITWRKCQIIHFFVIPDMPLLFKMTTKIFPIQNRSARISQEIYSGQNLKESLVLFCAEDLGIYRGPIPGFSFLILVDVHRLKCI